MAAKTFTTTAAVLDASTTRVVKGTQVRAAPANTGTVYLGYSSAVTANTADATDGVPLAAGESYFVPASKAKSPSKIWLIGSAASQKVFFDPL